MVTKGHKKDVPDDFEEVELEDVEEAAAHVLKKLKDKLKECQKERSEYLDGWQRAQAEMMNTKKRLSDERDRDKDRTKVMFVEQLLPLADSFESAMGDSSWGKADLSWRTGVEQIHGQLQSIFSNLGVVKTGVVGEPFDPSLHDAVSSEPVDDSAKHNTVTRVLQSGYGMNTMIIRPAKVVVGESVH